MNRRILFRQAMVAGAAAIMPGSLLNAEINKQAGSKLTATYKRFNLGDLEITIVSDGYIAEKSVQPFLAPRAAPSAVKQALESHFRPTDRIDLAINIMIIRNRQRVYLLDTGLGMFADENTGWMMEQLKNAGFTIAQVTDIILSHAHPDHMGGLVKPDGSPRFPKAKVHMSAIEHNFWMSASIADFVNSGLRNEPDFLNMFIPAARKILVALKHSLHFVDTSATLDGIFTFELAPGHTPGLLMTTIGSHEDQLMYIADLIHSDALLFEHPEWGFSGDTDLDMAIASRIRLLEKLTTTKMKTFACHLPWPGLGHVRRKGNAFEWVPEVYATP